MQQLVVTGKYADGSVRDLTACCTLTAEVADVVRIGENGFLQPIKEGATTLIVKAGAQTARVPVAVKDFDKPQPVSFRNELIAALNVGGCNAGACHGTPSGKNGFKLSLRGYDPAADYLQLTRDVLGRRTDRLDPDASLILQKSLGRVPHEGGQRFSAEQHARPDHPRLAGRGPARRPGQAAGADQDRGPARRPRAATRRPAGSSWPSWPTSPTAASAT